MPMLEPQGVGGSSWAVYILAAIVVGWICCALSYVSTILSVSATAGVMSQLAGPIDADVVYPDAEASLKQAAPAEPPPAAPTAPATS